MKFTVTQEKVLRAFTEKDTDIDIVVLYNRIYGDPGTKSVREMQQRLAPCFVSINGKLDKAYAKCVEKTGNPVKARRMMKIKSIELGDIKRTYRLITHKV